MTRRTETIDAAYFDGLYQADTDPWRFRTSDYEADKYAATLAALRRDHYDTTLEVGCSIGVFTSMLAPRCDRLLAIDGSRTALAAARTACAGQSAVRFEQRMIPGDFPAGRFDLIVLSEVLYYLTAEDLARAAADCVAAQGAGGEMVVCHWLGETDYPLTGLAATEAFVAAVRPAGYDHEVLAGDIYRLDRLVRTKGSEPV